LQYKEKQKYDEGGNAIIPFAQKEMTHRFVKGIDIEYKMEILDYVENLLDTFPRILIESLKNNNNISASSSYLDSLLGALLSMKSNMTDDFLESIDEYEKKNYQDPIIRKIGNLPKEELGVMAKTFVNITSFKRRVSRDEEETVGGPIDVAIISKGDGYVWVKRKQYFDSELNRRFPEN
jgi:hypothetical protein